MSEKKDCPFPNGRSSGGFSNARPSSGSRIFLFDKVQHLLCEFEQAVHLFPPTGIVFRRTTAHGVHLFSKSPASMAPI